MVEPTKFLQLFQFLWSHMHQAFGGGVDTLAFVKSTYGIS